MPYTLRLVRLALGFFVGRLKASGQRLGAFVGRRLGWLKGAQGATGAEWCGELAGGQRLALAALLWRLALAALLLRLAAEIRRLALAALGRLAAEIRRLAAEF